MTCTMYMCKYITDWVTNICGGWLDVTYHTFLTVPRTKIDTQSSEVRVLLIISRSNADHPPEEN